MYCYLLPCNKVVDICYGVHDTTYLEAEGPNWDCIPGDARPAQREGGYLLPFAEKGSLMHLFSPLWIFVTTLRLPLVAACRGYSLLWPGGFSLQRPPSWQSTGSGCTGFSSCSLQALEHVDFSGCSLQALEHVDFSGCSTGT